MQLAKSLPKYLLRHKIIDMFIRFGLQNKFTEISFNGNSKAFVDLTDPEPRNVFIKKTFEPVFVEVANSFLPHNGVFFDIGSNVGFCTFGLIPNKPDVTYHMFEANHKLIHLIKKSINLYQGSKCCIVNACVTDKIGITKFHLSKNQTGQSHIAVGKEEGIQVTNVVLDIYCKEKCISNIDFVKVDLEGNEIPALKGFNNLLSTQRIRALYIEVIPENQKRYNFSSFELLSYLESKGYTLFLCKSDDFGYFGNLPFKQVFRNGTLMINHFTARDYPHSFATDVLAVSNRYLKSLPSQIKV